jgi:hypothetical protein
MYTMLEKHICLTVLLQCVAGELLLDLSLPHHNLIDFALHNLTSTPSTSTHAHRGLYLTPMVVLKCNLAFNNRSNSNDNSDDDDDEDACPYSKVHHRGFRVLITAGHMT